MRSPRQFEAPDLEAVAAYVSRRLGVDFGRSRRAELLGRLDRLMERRGVPHAERYLSVLDRDPAAFEELVDAMTVGETYFFREPGHFEVLVRRVLPELGDRPPGRKVRLWSAGCATGAEAYSLAIVMTEHAQVPFQVLGTDVSGPALDVAVSGTYSRWALRTVDERARETYFERCPGGFRVRLEYAEHVAFRRLNLLAGGEREDELPPMDVVFCRNVLIYLTPDAVQAATRKLVAALAPGGWLITASSDPPLGHVPDLHVVRTPAGIVYRRAPAVGSPVRSPVAVAEPAGPAQPRSSPEPEPSRPSSVTGGPQPATEAHVLDAAAARAALDRGDHERAEEAARSLAERSAGGAEPYAIMVRALANRGRLAEARRCCEVAIARFPMVAELRYLHCMALLDEDRADEAVHAARAAVYLRSDLAVAHVALGRAESSLGKQRSAARSFRNAAQLLRALPEDDPVPLGDGETAGRLATLLEAHELLLTQPRSTGAGG